MLDSMEAEEENFVGRREDKSRLTGKGYRLSPIAHKVAIEAKVTECGKAKVKFDHRCGPEAVLLVAVYLTKRKAKLRQYAQRRLNVAFPHHQIEIAARAQGCISVKTFRKARTIQ